MQNSHIEDPQGLQEMEIKGYRSTLSFWAIFGWIIEIRVKSSLWCINLEQMRFFDSSAAY